MGSGGVPDDHAGYTVYRMLYLNVFQYALNIKN